MDDRQQLSEAAFGGIEKVFNELHAVEDCLRTLGCRILPGSRLDTFRRAIIKFQNRTTPPSQIFWRVLAFGARDLFEISFICNKLGKDHRRRLVKEIPRLLKERDLPGQNTLHEDARNIQSELFRAAELVHSGFEVLLDEPDIRFVLDNIPVGIAVKRPTQRNLQECVHKGVKQIEQSGLSGFLALSLDRFQAGYIHADSSESFDAAAKAIFRNEMMKCAKKIHWEIAKPHIIGINVSYCGVGRIGTPWNVAFHNISHWLPRSDDATNEDVLVKKLLDVLKSPTSI